MKSETHGAGTSEAEVANIDAHGIWLFVKGREYFLPHEEYPWFKDAKVSDVLHVQLLHGVHLYWPDLDVDLCLESLGNPSHYPLIAKA